MWVGIAQADANGNFTIDYSDAEFKEIVNIQATPESNTAMQAERPSGAYIASKTLTQATGTCYSITSTGVLVAVQAIPVSQPTTINILIVGK